AVQLHLKGTKAGDIAGMPHANCDGAINHRPDRPPAWVQDNALVCLNQQVRLHETCIEYRRGWDGRGVRLIPTAQGFVKQRGEIQVAAALNGYLPVWHAGNAIEAVCAKTGKRNVLEGRLSWRRSPRRPLLFPLRRWGDHGGCRITLP